MKWNFVLLGVATLILAGIVGFAIAHGADLRILNPQGPVGLEERWVIGATVLLSAIVVIPVFVMLFFFAWRYRANGPNAHLKHAPNWDHDSWVAESVWWFIPAVIIVVLSVIAWKTTHELDPYKALASSNPPVVIDVVALNWKWLFIYPAQDIASVNLVEFPQNTPVHFYITSDAPMNSFWIPSLGGQIMAMPGMTTQMNLLASNVDTYNGFSANISGTGFAGMAFSAKSVPESEFNAWVASARQDSNPALTSASYAALAKPSEYNTVAYYSSIVGNIFSNNVMKYMMPFSSPLQPTSPTTSGEKETSSTMQGMHMSTTTP